MKLEPRTSAAGVRLIAHEVLGWPSAELSNLVRRGARGRFWVTAGRQRAGRGRRGRRWISPPGNLYASLVPTGPAAAEHWPQLSVVAALAIHDAVVEVAGDLKPLLAIKWPNDLLLAGAKFAGILIEGEGDVNAVAIGIGVNCARHPADTEFPATDLAAAGVPVAPKTLFLALSVKMLGRIAQWNAGEGFSTIRADWLARASGVGEGVRVRLAEPEIAGLFQALGQARPPVLRLPGGNVTTNPARGVFKGPSASPDKAG